MTNEVEFDLEIAHAHFAKSTNGRTWELLSKEKRTTDEDFEVVFTACASLYHWAQIGTCLQLQRGEWLLSHVYIVLGYGEAALRHAERCYQLTQDHAELMQDFDLAYAEEGIARALAIVGRLEQAKQHYDKAKTAGEALVDDEDREIFMGDFGSGDWYGLV